jgi:uncharacterized protein YggE
MGITVSGIGEGTGRPDVVDIDVGVSALAGTVAEATAVATEKAGAVTAALTSAGIAPDDLTTTEFSIRPEYDYSGNEQRLLGYRVSNMVRARLRDINITGSLLDAVTGAGGDETRVAGLSFGVANEAALQAQAREVAWEDAVSRATQLAALSGQTLGKTTSITEVVRPPIAPVRMLAADMAMEKSTPIQPGTTTVSVTLEVEFAIGD